MMCKKNCQGYKNFSILLLHNSAFLMGLIYELGDLAGGLGVGRSVRLSGENGQEGSFLWRLWDSRGSAPNNPEQGFEMGSGRRARFQIWKETQPQGPGGPCWLKGPGAQRRCPEGWATPSSLLVHPAASGLSPHPSHALVTVVASWGQSRPQPCH